MFSQIVLLFLLYSVLSKAEQVLSDILVILDKLLK